jgi:hypothetical protein
MLRTNYRRLFRLELFVPKSRQVSNGNSDRNFDIMMAPSSFSSLKASLRVLGHRSVSLSAVAYFRQSLTASIYSIKVEGC